VITVRNTGDTLWRALPQGQEYSLLPATYI